MADAVKRMHALEYRQERFEMDELRRASATRPYDELLISMDTMDSNKTEIPHPNLYRETYELEQKVGGFFSPLDDLFMFCTGLLP
jgi:hypothetical protein